MRILFLHQHFHPETVGTSTRAVEIVDHLVRQGHDVTVVTGIPSHPSTMASGEVVRNQPRQEEFRGARVHRVWAYGSRKADTFIRRMLTYGSFMVLGGLKALFLPGKYDVLVAVSPLPNGVAGMLVSRLRGIPLLFDVCDIWPDCAVAVGMMPTRGLLLRVAQQLETMVYRRSRRIGVVTRGFTENLVQKGVPRDKVRLLPDWVEPEVYDEARVDRAAVRLEFNLEGRFVVSFLGNFGLIMGLEAILDTARLVQEKDSEVLFLFVGKGVARPMIEERIKRDGLKNVRVMPYQPRHRVPELLAASDALIVTYKRSPITLITVPSKIYEYMSIGRPIVAGVEGVIGEILAEAGCGAVSRERNPEEMAEAILRLKSDADLGKSMGKAGREYVIQHFSFAKVAADYEQAVAETAGAEVSRNSPGDGNPR